ncbi:MAG: valine--tRNA ligase [Legionellaceae bacterium]|nr:valine--tRNA ligase [Legionellaceae bacterium]
MEKTYTPEAIESHCYADWERSHAFSPHGEGPSFCIMLPPPNVTGSLHMGHGFQHTLMDILTRYHRMIGAKTLWQPGVDHAGISTQLVVERNLEARGVSRKEMTREAFLEETWKWKEQYGKTITQQMRRLGSSVDWTKERFTMDPAFSAAVQKVFIQLYEEGLIYRGTRLVNWDPKLGTAVSDLEVISEEEDGFLWHIRYPLVDGSGEVVVATTRPETLLGDVAVAVHPEDERYSAFIGKEVHLPLCNRTIPIIADTYVDPSFGSGCVKITPAHDHNDYAVGKRHQLPLISILTKKATLNKKAPVAYQGMDRFVAREQIIQDLTAQGFLVQTVPHKLKVPRGEKSNVIIEPLLTDQWYVKMQSLAEPAIEAVQRGDVRLIPETWNKTYFQWMENIEDWCISRQLWWGHRIPAWYDNQGRVFVGNDEAEIRKRHELPDTISLKQDEDVLDTWFSSSLWPFATLGWPEKTDALKTFFPTSVLITGFDIIFFWVARMIMMSLKCTGQVPFREVLITGLIRDSDGHKMSKSKGNVIDPLDVIDGIGADALVEKRTAHLMLPSLRDKIAKATLKEYPEGIPAFGTDALRFTYCALANFGRNIRFDLARVAGYRNFCNKLWNASRYVLLSMDQAPGDWEDGAFQYSLFDRWILSRLQQVIQESQHCLQQYRFDFLANLLYDFVWHSFCDWYLELSKIVLQDPNALPALKRGTRHTLMYVLDNILRLLHPIMPFITQTIGEQTVKYMSDRNESMISAAYPKIESQHIDLSLEQDFVWFQSVVQALRTLRSEMMIAPNKKISLIIKTLSMDLHNKMTPYAPALLHLSKVTNIKYVAPKDNVPQALSTVVDGIEFLIPMAGLVDKQAELGRLEKELNKLQKELEGIQAKLSNQDFIARAPEAIVQKEKEKANGLENHRKVLLQHRAELESL